MNSKDYSIYSTEEISQLVLDMSPEEIQREIAKMAPLQVSAAIIAMECEHDQEWSEKLCAAYLGLSTQDQLVAAGKSLNFIQALEVLENSAKCDPSFTWKLSPILVGLSHPVFQQILASALKPHIEVLQHEAISESLQHHLTLFVHDASRILEEQADFLKTLIDEITAIDPILVTQEELSQLQQNLDNSTQTYDYLLEKINKALALAWNTNRADLINKLSILKDICLKIINQQIGSPRTSTSTSTGLYALLEDHLNQVYGNPSNRNDIEALNDDEPAIEALTKLSLWYLKDYWEIGLLPQIKDIHSLDLESKGYSEKECADYREKLLSQIHANLEKICLSTVGDLKAAQIYSKQMLQDYIEHHAHLLI